MPGSAAPGALQCRPRHASPLVVGSTAMGTSSGSGCGVGSWGSSRPVAACSAANWDGRWRSPPPPPWTQDPSGMAPRSAGALSPRRPERAGSGSGSIARECGGPAVACTGGGTTFGTGISTGGVVRGRSPKGRSPKSSPSPDASRSPSSGHRQRGVGCGSCHGFQCLGGPVDRRNSPRAASPFNARTDFDIFFDLPQEIEWHRFEAQVGVADWAADSWPPSSRARFLLIDDDAQAVLWESSDALEPWAPTELCSVLLSGGAEPGVDAGASGLSGRSASAEPPATPHHICLRVQCAEPPEGALWIEPTITALKPSGPSACSWLPPCASAGSSSSRSRAGQQQQGHHPVLAAGGARRMRVFVADGARRTRVRHLLVRSRGRRR
mmetsp:Transcript_89197/g.247723  ORF Transcript_89197/g.247723 Transcript_89197/m.247723 type:complete len:381 (-) Transcript_89197:277-1419(-)